MGFHYVNRVYAEVKGTSPTAQAILAYLAHRADDVTGRCYPAYKTIIAATHFSKGALENALHELAEKKFLTWIKGGRTKTGHSKANEYTILLPSKISVADVSSSAQQMATAVTTKKALQWPPDEHCSDHQKVTINHRSNKDQPSHQPSVGGDEQSQMKELMELGVKELAKTREAEAKDIKEREKKSLLQEAVDACGSNDLETRKYLTNAMLGKDPMDCLETIQQFASELSQGELAKARSLPRMLCSRLAKLTPVK